MSGAVISGQTICGIGNPTSTDGVINSTWLDVSVSPAILWGPKTALGWPDSGVPVATGGGQLSSAEGTASADAALLPAIEITGTPTANEVPVASSGTAAAWGPVPPAPALAYSAAKLASPVTLSKTVATTAITTASLGIGTWLVNVVLTVSNSDAAPTTCEATAAGGTATVSSFAGAYGAEDAFPGVTVGECTILHLSFEAVVTVAGTIVISVKSPNGTTANVVESATPTTSYGGASGYTAVRVL